MSYGDKFIYNSNYFDGRKTAEEKNHSCRKCSNLYQQFRYFAEQNLEKTIYLKKTVSVNKKFLDKS